MKDIKEYEQLFQKVSSDACLDYCTLWLPLVAASAFKLIHF